MKYKLLQAVSQENKIAVHLRMDEVKGVITVVIELVLLKLIRKYTR